MKIATACAIAAFSVFGLAGYSVITGQSATALAGTTECDGKCPPSKQPSNPPVSFPSEPSFPSLPSVPDDSSSTPGTPGSGSTTDVRLACQWALDANGKTMAVRFTNTGDTTIKAGTGLDALIPGKTGLGYDLARDLKPGQSIIVHSKLAWPGETPQCVAKALDK